MLQKVKNLYNEYPQQYWVMIAGVVISTAGGSMIWPFLLIYASAKLNMPLSTVATLISINAGTGLLSSFLAGTLADKVGRKVVMNFSLTLSGIVYFFLMRAETYPQFVILMILVGLSNPLYQVGADAMLADMIPSEKRTDAYAVSRIANNAAFALGPAVGGFLAASSYNLAFYGAAIGYLIYSLLLFFLARETLEKQKASATQMIGQEAKGQDGYAQVFRDKGYVFFVSLTSIGLIAPSILWILMPVYTNTNFGIPENLYGWIPTTNALMCVVIQYPVTQLTRHYKTLPVTALGMLIYALGVGSVALMSGFNGFWLSMVILTFGELVVVPTASKYVADIAPANLRGRYMSVYWLGWGLARMLAPLIGGFLNDAIAPRAIWIGGLIIGLISVTGLTMLSLPRRRPSEPLSDHH
ncbi:MFS transporter [Candidatus Villigracilis saccharophilus]|uniref:MDR family MFS transporter n=1 Tax=Candidatus Villigracilis saccharophilus TaxID=3140684 RepID=UPI0031350FB3|nr:MFS transporter [Anaerolineales bacterium]